MSANTMHWDSRFPTDVLEMRAEEQRQKIHQSMLELRSHMHQALDLRRQARQHLLSASAAAAGLGLLLGYGAAGIFSRPQR